MTRQLATTRHVRRVFHVALLAGAMLASGCFHAGTSVKQSMTSGAPIAVPAAAAARQPGPTDLAGIHHAGVEKAANQHFDLHKPEVESSVTVFQTSLRGFFDQALDRSSRYVSTMTDILVREGLPAELAYLPLIESGYRPEAVSPAGAAGPWQFIPETGRRYGLRIDSLVDERRDPIKSTHAAVQYLKDLHDMFGDWELSLAAYNSGEYRVARILAQTDAGDYWDMRSRGYLPTETSQYVPRFLAAVRIASAPESYGFDAPAYQPLHFELVNVDRQVSLHTAGRLCGVSASELADLNPELRRGITPSGYALRVPTGAAEPLRVALASYVEPVRVAARTPRNGRRGVQVVRSSRASARVVSRATRPTRGGQQCPTALTKAKPSQKSRKTEAVRDRKPVPLVSRKERGADGSKRREAELEKNLGRRRSGLGARSLRASG
jgi:hypothetical protein